jgi:hypothetical protein
MTADGVDPKALERDLWDIAAALPQLPKHNASSSLPLNG